MGFSERQQAIYAALESVPGTAETLAGTDFIQAANLQPNFADQVRIVERPIIQSSLNPAQALYAGALFGFQFEAELKGSGSAGTPPRLSPLLRACGLSETVTTGVSVTYAPVSDISAHDTVTIGYREGDNFRTIAGCRGSFSLNAPAGRPAMLTFTFMGRIDDESESAAPAASAETTLPPNFSGATFSIGGYAAPIGTLAFDLSNTIEPGSNPNNADGFADLPIITARASGGSVDPEREAIGDKDYVGIFRANTTQAIQTGTIGATAGNRWAFAMPTAYFRNVGPGSRGGLLTYDIQFGAADTDGTNDFSLTMT